ncbi:MAG: MATE family efflux transporter, partial [Eubacteriaceae bacterium]
MNKFRSLSEPKNQISGDRKLFSDLELRELIWPLFIEQLLVMLVGIADTLMVSYAGEAAVSGVSLDNMFVTVFIYLFTALAAGGAVVVSQYLGSGDRKSGNLAASQIFTVSLIFSVAVMVFTLAFNRLILRTLFGSVDDAVMDACITYLNISAYSFPALALYNAGAALFRSMGNTRTAMNVSILMNIINVAGNAVGIFVLHAGVAGVAWPTFASRVFAAVTVTVLCFKKSNPVCIDWKGLLSWHQQMVKRLLGIAVPNGVEQGLFQLTKVALGSVVALFGTSQIAANGVAQSIWSLAAVIGTAMGPV